MSNHVPSLTVDGNPKVAGVQPPGARLDEPACARTS
jgi:hypothetical protein